MRQNVEGKYRGRKRPGIIAWVTIALSLLAAVFTSFFLAGTSTVSRQGGQQIEGLTVNNVSSPPGFADADCWQVGATVTETNYLGTDLLRHRFAATWCARGGGVVCRADNTEVQYEAKGMRSVAPADSDYRKIAAIGSAETIDITLVRGVQGSTGWSSYGFERCVKFSVDAHGKAEGMLTCNLS
ncbi:MAG: hypothetical protein Q3965_02520 [Rothia sp. (in: high G+C Gram-positive bacteria)]|nr:hypothetical protein [Rothia sp. (in: high G+C Gram-positive bacteria)]